MLGWVGHAKLKHKLDASKRDALLPFVWSVQRQRRELAPLVSACMLGCAVQGLQGLRMSPEHMHHALQPFTAKKRATKSPAPSSQSKSAKAAPRQAAAVERNQPRSSRQYLAATRPHPAGLAVFPFFRTHERCLRCIERLAARSRQVCAVPGGAVEQVAVEAKAHHVGDSRARNLLHVARVQHQQVGVPVGPCGGHRLRGRCGGRERMPLHTLRAISASKAGAGAPARAPQASRSEAWLKLSTGRTSSSPSDNVPRAQTGIASQGQTGRGLLRKIAHGRGCWRRGALVTATVPDPHATRCVQPAHLPAPP